MKTLIFVYIFFIILMVLVGLSRFFPLSPFWAAVVLFGLIFVPGFSLSQIIKIKSSDFIEQLVTWMSLGWLLILVAGILAMIFKINIDLLSIIYVWFTLIIFSVSFILDIIRKNYFPVINLKAILNFNNLPSLFVLVISIILLLLISNKGALFKGGDTLYHLSILRKVIDGAPLTIQNLAYVKDSPDVAYIFPLWHIVMGLVTTIAHTNMFMIYREMPFSLSIMVFLVWYWLFRLIFPTKSFALIAFILFAFFNFNWNFGYIFSTLSIPHTLTQLLFLPLLVGLSMNYFFNNKSGKINFALIPFLAILAGCIHLTVFFYFLFIITSLTLLFGLLCFKDPDFKPVFLKMVWLLGLNLGLILILALVIQLKTQSLTIMWSNFGSEFYPTELRYTAFSDMGIFIKYAFLALPLVLVLSKNHRKLLLILAGYLVFLVAYISPLHHYLNQILGYIFMKRLYVNVIWYWLPIGLVFGYIGLLLDQLINRFRPVWQRTTQAMLGLVIILLIWTQAKYQIAMIVYNKVTADTTNAWLNQYTVYLLIGLSILALLVYLAQIRWPKVSKMFVLTDFPSPIAAIFVIFVCVFFLAAPNYQGAIKIVKLNYSSILFSPTTVTAEKYSLSYIGGQKALDFINQNIPAKSIFNTYGGFFYLPTVADMHMTSYSSTADTDYGMIYKSSAEISLENRISILSQIKAEYLLINASPAKSKIIQENLDANPEYFTKIYKDKVVIYQVNQANISNSLLKNAKI